MKAKVEDSMIYFETWKNVFQVAFRCFQCQPINEKLVLVQESSHFCFQGPFVD